MTTDDAVPAASTSAWVWSPQYQLYWNSDKKQWAKPLANGEWEYADAVPSAGSGEATKDDKGGEADEGKKQQKGVKETRRLLVYDDDGPVDEPEPEPAIPEEQLWPDDDEPPDPFANAPLLRLVVLKRPDPSVLPAAQVVASVDPSEPVSIGRDKSFERRIRLRELAVSKVHCTLFWSVEPELDDGGYWALVDNGSTHGTFLSSEGVGKTRLSESKVASVPHRLHHLDTLHVGSTTFSVHIHPSFACSACSVASDSSNLIPLVPAPAEDASSTPGKSAYTTKTKEEKEQDRREQMRGLREKLLKPEAGSGGGKGATRPSPAKANGVTSSSPAFVDRAAARRQRDAGASPSSSLAAASSASSSFASSSSRSKPALNPFFAVPGPAASFSAAPSPAKADPFGSESRGAKLLSKLAGSSASPAGNGNGGASGSGAGLGTLIQPRTADPSGGREAGRAGLGSRKLVEIEKVAAAQGGGGVEKRDWREDVREASRKRFREMG
ncbi:hypothetical protein JCM8097_007643 [Rhodosporidiobolus ruineniae]